MRVTMLYHHIFPAWLKSQTVRRIYAKDTTKEFNEFTEVKMAIITWLKEKRKTQILNETLYFFWQIYQQNVCLETHQEEVS